MRNLILFFLMTLSLNSIASTYDPYLPTLTMNGSEPAKLREQRRILLFSLATTGSYIYKSCRNVFQYPGTGLQSMQTFRKGATSYLESDQGIEATEIFAAVIESAQKLALKEARPDAEQVFDVQGPLANACNIDSAKHCAQYVGTDKFQNCLETMKAECFNERRKGFEHAQSFWKDRLDSSKKGSDFCKGQKFPGACAVFLATMSVQVYSDCVPVEPYQIYIDDLNPYFLKFKGPTQLRDVFEATIRKLEPDMYLFYNYPVEGSRLTWLAHWAQLARDLSADLKAIK